MSALPSMESAPSIEASVARLRDSVGVDINNSEPLVTVVDARRLFVRTEYHRIGLKHAEPLLRVRESVKARLEIAANLLPAGMSLVVLDGWRSAALQQELYEYFDAKLSPSVDRERYIFNPAKTGSAKSYPTDAPPHRTGGAVDVMLGDAAGNLLLMGAAYDEMTPLAATAAFEESGSVLSDDEARLVRLSRRTLFHAMASAGFSNYPEEFWHYDFGNSFWRFYSGVRGEGMFAVSDKAVGKTLGT